LKPFYISTARIHKQIPLRSADRTSASIHWIFWKWPFQSDIVLDCSTMTRCSVSCPFLFRCFLYTAKDEFWIERFGLLAARMSHGEDDKLYLRREGELMEDINVIKM
jgi:hypothetical protein